MTLDVVGPVSVRRDFFERQINASNGINDFK